MSRNARLALVLAVALGAAGAASFAVYRVVAAIPVREVEVKSVGTVVAAKTIPVGTIVTRDHVCTHLLQVLREEAGVPMHAAQKLLVESVASALVLIGYPPTSVKTERFGPTGG